MGQAWPTRTSDPKRRPELMRLQLNVLLATLVLGAGSSLRAEDAGKLNAIREIQNQAIDAGRSPVAHWGSDPSHYAQWTTHTNRLIPIYAFGTLGAGKGIDLQSYTAANSVYRDRAQLERLFGQVPEGTYCPTAEYCDQTNIYDLQAAALAAGKRNIFLVIFDGMDWHPARAAAIAAKGTVYSQGRGTGLFFLDYTASNTTQYGFMVTAPYGEAGRVDVDTQTIANVTREGGYNPDRGGAFPWSIPPAADYVKGTDSECKQPYTDSSASASAMTAGNKTYNGALNITPAGGKAQTIAHQAQQAGYAVGTVTNVPISHATPASAYAHNVSRSDYQDITRDMLGLRSISHPDKPLPGLTVVIGTGAGIVKKKDKKQGKNFVAGNQYLTAEDLSRCDVRNGGEYLVCQRTAGQKGIDSLADAARQAADRKQKLLGFFGTRYSHLPYQTADGDYQPAKDRSGKAEEYTPADLAENPSLAEMTQDSPDGAACPQRSALVVGRGR